MAKVSRTARLALGYIGSQDGRSDGAGWLVLSGSGARREVSHEMVAKSGLRLVPANVPPSKYEPVARTAGITSSMDPGHVAWKRTYLRVGALPGVSYSLAL